VDSAVERANKPPSLLTPAFVTVVVAQMAFSYAVSTFMLLPKYLATALHASASQIGRTSALPGFAIVMLTPFVGGLLDRLGRRPLISVGAFLCAIYACAWIAIDRVGPASYALQILNGCAFVLTFNAASTLVTEDAPPERIGQAIGLFGAANISMNAIAPSVAEPLAASYGWHAAFGLAAGAALLALVLSRRIVERARPAAPAPMRNSMHPGHLRHDLRDTLRVGRRIGLHIGAMISCGAAYGAILTFYQPFVLAQGAKHVSGFFVGFTVATVSMRLFLGGVADRVGRRKVAQGAFMAYACIVLAMTQVTPGRLLGFGMLFGAAHGLFYPALNALSIERTKPDERSRVMTLINGSFHLGFMSSVLCFGWVAEHSGYRTVFVLASLVTCIGLALLFLDGLRARTETVPTRA
jgi:MFS family permease